MASEAGWLGSIQSINQSIFSMSTPDLTTAYFKAPDNMCRILDGQKVFEPSVGVLPTTGWLIANRPTTAMVLGLLSLSFVVMTWKVMLRHQFQHINPNLKTNSPLSKHR